MHTDGDVLAALSLPVRGAWVEMPAQPSAPAQCRSSLPVRGAWVEIAAAARCSAFSCGERGLKYQKHGFEYCVLLVAPRAGSVG